MIRLLTSWDMELADCFSCMLETKRERECNTQMIYTKKALEDLHTWRHSDRNRERAEWKHWINLASHQAHLRNVGLNESLNCWGIIASMQPASWEWTSTTSSLHHQNWCKDGIEILTWWQALPFRVHPHSPVKKASVRVRSASVCMLDKVFAKVSLLTCKNSRRKESKKKERHLTHTIWSFTCCTVTCLVKKKVTCQLTR
jgi:hypothetical protein